MRTRRAGVRTVAASLVRKGLTGLACRSMGCVIDVYLPTEARARELLDAITDLLVAHGLGVGNDSKIHTVVTLRSCEWSQEKMLDQTIAVSVPTNSGVTPPQLHG
jgi:hypothetical protein